MFFENESYSQESKSSPVESLSLGSVLEGSSKSIFGQDMPPNISRENPHFAHPILKRNILFSFLRQCIFCSAVQINFLTYFSYSHLQLQNWSTQLK